MDYGGKRGYRRGARTESRHVAHVRGLRGAGGGGVDDAGVRELVLQGLDRLANLRRTAQAQIEEKIYQQRISLSARRRVCVSSCLSVCLSVCHLPAFLTS
eukprot:COSAG05_NODE_883_length_6777_cov_36.660081_6_plen_100_part_00